MLIANSLDLWQRNGFFSTSVKVQQSADVYFHCPLLLRMDLLSILFEVPFFHHVAILFFFFVNKIFVSIYFLFFSKLLVGYNMVRTPQDF